MGRKRFKFRKPLSLDGLFYSHGLMCASYPRTVLALVAVIVISFSLPFFVTSSGDLNKPITWRSPWLNYRIPGPRGSLEWIIKNPTQSSDRTPSWFHGLPVAVVQQVYVHLHVNCERLGGLCDRPYDSTSKLAAAHLINKMEHTISGCRNFIHPSVLNLTSTLGSTHTTTPPPAGILSPVLDSVRAAWEEDTPLDYQTIKELVYGGFWEHAHYSADAMREDSQSSSESPSKSGRDRSLVFALTMMLSARGHEDFPELVRCADSIARQWEGKKAEFRDKEHKVSLKFLKHIYYEREWSWMDFAPLMCVYSIVFLYISFSVGKIDLVKSKIGLGITAFITVVASLTMSLGVCTFFGLSISLSGSEIYPYVVIILGLENILIIVKAVITTPEELEVKYRIGVGMSREGRAITHNLVTLVALTSFGIMFFNYELKEFCIIAVVGLICDGFLQLFLFPTVLSIDLRRLELSDLSSSSVPVPENVPESHSQSSSSCRPRCPSSFQVTTPMRWHSKRIKFIYFLARTRIVSRFMMVSLLVLLCALFVKTDVFHSLVNRIISSHSSSQPPTNKPDLRPDVDQVDTPTTKEGIRLPRAKHASKDAKRKKQYNNDHLDLYWTNLMSELNGSEIGLVSQREEDGFAMMCEGRELCWRPMVSTHLPRLLNYTGYATEGRFLTLLPPINLDFNLGHTPDTYPSPPPISALAHFISQPLVIRLSAVLAVVTVVISYAIHLVQSSWYRHQRYLKSVKLKNYDKMASLKGHTQDIDLMCVDGSVAVTTSLDGDVRVWDLHPMKRRCIRQISRSNLCRSPPPEVSSSSQRPAAEGCEASQVLTPGTATPTGKYHLARNGRRFSAISSHSSTSDGCWDWHGNGDQWQETRNSSGVPHSASRLSDVADVSDSDQLQQTSTPRGSRLGSAHAHNQQQSDGVVEPAVIPVREFPSMDKMALGNPTYSSPHKTASNPPAAASAAATPSLPSLPQTGSYPTSAYASQLKPHPSSQSMTYTSSQSVPHPSSQQVLHPTTKPMPHPSSQQVPHPTTQALLASRPMLVSFQQPTRLSSQLSTSNSQHSPQVHVQLELDGDHTHVTPPRMSSVSSAMPTSYSSTSAHNYSSIASSSSPHLVNLEGLAHRHSQEAPPTSLEDASRRHSQPAPHTSYAAHRHSRTAPPTSLEDAATRYSLTTSLSAASWSNSIRSPLHTPTNVSTPLDFSESSTITNTSSCGSQVGSGFIPAAPVTVLTPPTSSNYRRGHARHASLGNNSTSLSHLTHSRNRSLGSVTISDMLALPPPPSPLPTFAPHRRSMGNISNSSPHGSKTNLLADSGAQHSVDKEKGYDFAQHFNLFSQYTSNMALEHCLTNHSSNDSLPTMGACPPPPPVWCMDIHNKTIALGCKDGKVEVWNATTGSLVFEQTISSSGICTIAVGNMGVVAGQIDGSLSVMGHNGLLHHVIPAHDRAISILRLHGDSLLVSGSYDCSVKVHRTSTPLQRQLVCVNSIHVHEGWISALTILESQLRLSCVSGGSQGLVIHWNLNTGACINELGTYGSGVLQLESSPTTVVGLFSEGCLRVWQVANGELMQKISLGEMCSSFTLLTSQYVALSLESCIEVYDLESGCRHSPEVDLEMGVSCSSVGRHVQKLDEGSTIACTFGKDVYLIPCNLKLKND